MASKGGSSQATVYCYRDSVHRVNTEATFFELFLAFLLLMDSIIQTLAMYALLVQCFADSSDC